MGLITSKEIAKILQIEKFGYLGTFFGWLFLKTLRISSLNKIYEKHKDKKGVDFLNNILNEFQINFKIAKEDLKNIPEKGSFITISNHPLGGIDGIILLKILLELRPDFKLLANFLLQRVKPLKPYIFPVNPYSKRKFLQSSFAGIKNALYHLKDEKPLGIFPAGQVATKKEGNLIVDEFWKKGSIRIIQKAKVPVIPIYFESKNSDFFYFLSKISPSLITSKLPSEFFTQKNRKIEVRIGKPITVNEQDNYKNYQELINFLRKKTFENATL
ncbi:MAG: lysophospholipid acyltransferase family protein [Bacteroidota bacterium]